MFTFGQYDSIYGKPLIVLKEDDPWSIDEFSNIPEFIMYENGQIIYRKVENKHTKIYEVTLNKEELQQVIKHLSIEESFYKLENSFLISNTTCNASTYLVLNFDSIRRIKVEIIGDLLNRNERSNAPKELLTLYNKLINYKSSKAKEWLPNNIEVIFWKNNSAVNKKAWLQGFPDLNTSIIKIIENTEYYSVFFDKKYFKEFEKYYSSLTQDEAIEINGKQMSIYFKFPVPNMDSFYNDLN